MRGGARFSLNVDVGATYVTPLCVTGRTGCRWRSAPARQSRRSDRPGWPRPALLDSKARRWLWRRDLESGKSDAVLRGVSIAQYDISNDGKEGVFSTQPSGKASQLWLAHLDRGSPPKLIASIGDNDPR